MNLSMSLLERVISADSRGAEQPADVAANHRRGTEQGLSKLLQLTF